MEWLLTAFQTVGAALGFVATGITVWSYMTKERPTAIVVGAPLGGFGRRSGYLKVRNRSDRPILLHIEGGHRHGEFTVWPDHETMSAVYGAVEGARTTITIEPQSEWLLPLIEPSGFDAMDEDNEIAASISWSYAQPPFWRPRRKLRLSISKWSYSAVIAGVLREASGA